MDVIIALALLIIGGIAGFFANRIFSSASQEQRKLAEKVSTTEASLNQYKLDVADHLTSSAQLLEQMNNTCQTAMKQMQESTQLLQKATSVETDGMPFFSAETHAQLAETANLRRVKRTDEQVEEITQPPLDYSGEASGLFADKKQTVTTSD
jgi:uncharacterized membrane-anchored protein YhcB (DUF1043 family)